MIDEDERGASPVQSPVHVSALGREAHAMLEDITQASEQNTIAAEIADQSRDAVSDIETNSLVHVERMIDPDRADSVFLDRCTLEAHSWIDKAIEQSEKNIIGALQTQTWKEQETGDIPNVEWLTGEQFSISKGEEKIREFVETWKRASSWLYCIDYLCEEKHEYSKRYRYRVQWSVPTRRKPIPRATASVYFTIEISTVKPLYFPVNVYYIFEANKLVHRPGQSRFREKWLQDIVESKILMMNAIKF